MRAYFLFNSFTATADAGAQVQIVKNGRIRQVQWNCAADLDTDGELYVVELSLAPIFQGETNDAQGIVSIIRARYHLLTSGASDNGVNASFPVDVPVQAGQLLYLNAWMENGNVVEAGCLVWVS